MDDLFGKIYSDMKVITLDWKQVFFAQILT